MELNTKKTTTTISSHLRGNLNISGDALLAGQIDGNVVVDGTCELTGLVGGKLESKNIIIRDGGQVKNGVNCFKNLSIGDKCYVEGLVVCSNLIIDGMVVGNIEAENKVLVGPTGIVKGNIACQQLDVEENGLIEGNVSLNYKLFV